MMNVRDVTDETDPSSARAAPGVREYGRSVQDALRPDDPRLRKVVRQRDVRAWATDMLAALP